MGRDWVAAMPRWIHGGVIPACPCGAPSQDQVRRTAGGATVFWHCLVCERGRPTAPDWPDPLVAVTDAQWLLRNRRRQEWARNRSDPRRPVNIHRPLDR